MCHFRFEIPVNDRNRSQIESGMRTHQHPDPPSDGEDRPECETRNSRLLGTGQSLREIVDGSIIRIDAVLESGAHAEVREYPKFNALLIFRSSKMADC
jgi:hypothetical protein